MKQLLLGMATMSLASAGPVFGTATAPTPHRPAVLQTFVTELAQRQLQHGSDAWPVIAETTSWSALAMTTPTNRQETRWSFAIAAIGRSRPSDALGALDVMIADAPALGRVPAWRRARGVALALLQRPDEALAALGDPGLANDAETCLWSMQILANVDRAAPALAKLRCAMSALTARTSPARRPFLLAVARAAIDVGKPVAALEWLRVIPGNDRDAELLRGRADVALGQIAAGRWRFEAVARAGSPNQRAAATLAIVEAGVAAHILTPPAALARLDRLQFRWRGDDIERRTLTLELHLATDHGDRRRALAAGATLFRYFNLGNQSGPMIDGLQRQFVAMLSPQSTVPLDMAAGLLWDYRDLVPVGNDGDHLVGMLVDRLQAAGLYARAADLLDHRLRGTGADVEQGPLSIRIATLRILAGTSDAAIRVLRQTEAVPYPTEIRDDRHRVEAVALELKGDHAEALATLQDIIGTRALQAELHWRARDWTHFVAVSETMLPRGGLDAVSQTIVLRHAIGLALLDREKALAGLHLRYASGFAALATAPTFAILTAPLGAVDSARLTDAMTALPSVSPAGAFGDLLTAGDSARPNASQSRQAHAR